VKWNAVYKRFAQTQYICQNKKNGLMRNYLMIFLICFSICSLYSCASSKKSSQSTTAEEKKKEKEAKQARETELQQRGPVQPSTQKPAEPDTKTKTIPIPLENK